MIIACEGFCPGLKYFKRANLHRFGALWGNESPEKTVRQSITLPDKVAAQVRALAKTRRLSATRMLRELVEDGINAGKRKEQEFFELAELFRGEKDPEAAKLLGDRLGRMVFGG